MKFEFRGPQPPNIPAEIVGQELQRIHDAHDGIRPGDVVEEARPRDAVLHPAFEWSDKKAAAAYRVTQARALIRAVIVVAEPDQKESFAPVRAFVNVSGGDRTRLYRPILVAVSNPDEREQVLRRMRHELIGIRQRYEAFVEFAEIAEAMQGIEEALAATA